MILANDPLFSGDVGLVVVLIVLLIQAVAYFREGVP